MADDILIPLPWRIGGRNPDPLCPDEIAIMADVKMGQLVGPLRWEIVKDGSLCIATVMPVGVRPDRYSSMSDAAAEYLVRAANSHADLLAACQAALEFIRNGREFGYIRMPDPSTPDRAWVVQPMLEAAVLKATGGTP